MRALRWCSHVAAGLLLSVCASAIAMWAGGAAAGGGLAAAQESRGPTGLDHEAHAERVALAGAQAVSCMRCHAMDRRGRVAHRLGHEACFGECHGPRPQRGPRPEAPGRRAVCIVCHTADGLERPGIRRGLAVPSARLSPPEHGIRLSHAAHDAPSQGRGGCGACHAPDPGEARPPARTPAAPGTRQAPDAHARCTRCHLPAPVRSAPGVAETGPVSMNACTRCHVTGVVGLSGPRIAPGPYRVSFSHARHQARGHDDCRGCHAAMLAATGNELPAPRTEQCAACHDGARAFSVLGPHCRRCHSERPAATGLRPRRGPAFSHEQHQARALDLPCTRCHQLDARGVPLPSASDHAPCSDAGCHREDFAKRDPAICGACHLGTEPWLRLYFQPLRGPDTEFGARFSHRQHQPAGLESCERCHAQGSQLRDMGLPAQHETCTGTGCHEQTATAPDHPVGPLPLSACSACHELGLVARRRVQRIEARWSVRERFEHASHRRDPGTGAAVPCTGCHQGVAEADSVAEIPGPPKRACAPCHDGRVAFKLTGHGCARCHGGAHAP
jgi:c(7)-type cytochrome triheme protein